MLTRTARRVIQLPVALLVLMSVTLAQAPAVRESPSDDPGIAPRTAPVTLDGETLFRLRGVSAYPAEKRAADVSQRIRALADDPTFSPEMLRVVEEEGYHTIRARDTTVTAILNADATLEGVTVPILIKTTVKRIGDAIKAYRIARSPQVLWQNSIHALGVTLGSVIGLFLFLWIYKRFEKWAETFCKRRVEQVQIPALGVIQSDRLWTTVLNGLRFTRTMLLVIGVLAYLNVVLALFPWTRPFSQRVFEIVLDPLRTMGMGLFHALPDLAFLAVLFFVIRFLLRLTRMFFEAISRGAVSMSGFDPEWAAPTYRIARILIISFALIVAYPYLPGSGSEAFKGVSLFIGVIFSLGSSGAIANIIAGYSLTYRRAYKVGDRIKIGDVVGDVDQIRLQVTHIRSSKNEEIVIPNSVILNSNVLNYSSMAKQHGLILHTTVGIGYETPWRQVEAMLLQAAGKTEGILREPPPFILEKELGDFAVTYELNVYSDEPTKQPRIYAALHRNILDVFNEYGVQIMTPSYEADPPEPKLVPKDNWFAKPASGTALAPNAGAKGDHVSA